MTAQESLRELGTISLSLDFMRYLIDFGTLVKNEDGSWHIDKKLDPSNLQLTVWSEFIPEPFKEGALKAVEEIFQESLWYKPATEISLDLFFCEFQIKVKQARVQGLLNHQGWLLS